MRLFVAADLNSAMKDELMYLAGQIKASSSRCNITKETNLHLTLAFIGEYDEPEKVISALEKVSFPPFELTLSSLGSFARGDEKLVYAALGNDRNLFKLQKDITSALKNEGISFDKKRFTPHITIARRVTGYDGDIKDIKCRNVTSPVNSFVLYSSDLSEKSPVYTEVKRFFCR